MECWSLQPRAELQDELIALNPEWAQLDARPAPDGDADLEARDFSTFEVPACSYCAGMLKPDVVFFGESVPKERVDTDGAVEAADAMFVVGSSLMVYSGYRFAQAAARRQANRGRESRPHSCRRAPDVENTRSRAPTRWRF